jgi:hypothetical protein
MNISSASRWLTALLFCLWSLPAAAQFTPISGNYIHTSTDTYGLTIGDNTQSNLRIAGTASGPAGYGLIQTFRNGTTQGGTCHCNATAVM